MKVLRKLFFVFLVLFPILLCSCEFTSNPTNKKDVKITKISFDESQIEKKMGTDFDITETSITIHYDDSTTKELPINVDMVSEQFYNCLGSHDLVITYEGFSCEISYEICPKYVVTFMVNEEVYSDAENYYLVNEYCKDSL